MGWYIEFEKIYFQGTSTAVPLFVLFFKSLENTSVRFVSFSHRFICCSVGLQHLETLTKMEIIKKCCLFTRSTSPLYDDPGLPFVTDKFAIRVLWIRSHCIWTVENLFKKSVKVTSLITAHRYSTAVLVGYWRVFYFVTFTHCTWKINAYGKCALWEKSTCGLNFPLWRFPSCFHIQDVTWSSGRQF